MNQEYHLFKIGSNPYLFSPAGLIITLEDALELKTTVSYSQMRLYSFIHKNQEVHIVAFGEKLTVVFGRNDSLIRFLSENNVQTKTYKTKQIIVQQPVSKLKDLKAAFEDSTEHNLIVSISYLENWIRITLTDKEKLVFSYFNRGDDISQDLPDLDELDQFPVTHQWTGTVTPEKYPDEIYQYQEYLKKKKQSDNVASAIGCLVFIIIIGFILYNVFS